MWRWLPGAPYLLMDDFIGGKNNNRTLVVAPLVYVDAVGAHKNSVPEALAKTTLSRETNIPHPVYILGLINLTKIYRYYVTYLFFNLLSDFY